jgi:hypothetical protein
VLHLVVGVALAAPPVADRFDAWYLQETFRGVHAVPWLVAQLGAAPDDAIAVERWIRGLGQDWQRSGDLVRAQVERWAASRPDTPDVRAARVAAIVLAQMPDNTVTTRLSTDDAGPWCSEVEALVGAPADSRYPEGTYLLASWQANLAKTCGWDAEAANERARALALGGAAGPGRELYWRLVAGVHAIVEALARVAADFGAR